MALQPYLRPELTLVLGEIESRDALFAEIADRAAELISNLDAQTLFERLVAREQQLPTATPEGVAFPHAILSEIHKTMVGAVRLERGVDFGVPTYPPSDLVFFMFGPTSEPWQHVRILARLARIAHAESVRDQLRASRTGEELYQNLLAEDRSYG